MLRQFEAREFECPRGRERRKTSASPRTGRRTRNAAGIIPESTKVFGSLFSDELKIQPGRDRSVRPAEGPKGRVTRLFVQLESPAAADPAASPVAKAVPMTRIDA